MPAFRHPSRTEPATTDTGSRRHSDRPLEQIHTELITALAAELVPGAPTGWLSLTIVASAVGNLGQWHAHFRTAAGRVDLFTLPEQARAAVARHRRDSYRKHRGTWFSISAVLNADGTFTVSTAGHDRPAWIGNLPASACRTELETHPRAAWRVPGWLRTGSH